MKVEIVNNLGNFEGIQIKFFTKEFFEKNNGDLDDFRAKYGEKKIIGVNNSLEVLVGLGEKNDLNSKNLEELGCAIFKYVKCNKFKNIALLCEENDQFLLDILKGFELSDYSFDKYFTDEDKKKRYLENVLVVVKNKENIEKEYDEFSLLKENIFLCRDLVNEPANVIKPSTYADFCQKLTQYGLEVEIFGEKEMEKLGMGSLLSVGAGSVEESKFVVLKWQGLTEFKDPVAFVGKGITFDSGGLSLKPSNAMEDMKCDMAGSAVVVSLLKLLAQRKAKVNAVGVVALVENMPSGSATKVGDVVKSMSGQTIEIMNTDAEGRMILVDELYYTITKFKPKMVIDLATLTGAICVALGDVNAGLFTNNDDLAKEICDATEKTGELIWRMPLDKIGSKYDKMMDSNVADIKNSSNSRYAGSITAAQFLQRFIDGHKKWAHIDIAGTAFLDKDGYFVNKGATGFGVRLLNEVIKENYEEK